MKMPVDGRMYAMNEGNIKICEEGLCDLFRIAKKQMQRLRTHIQDDT